MRVMLDTLVWINLKEDKGFLKEFRSMYKENDIEVVFSHGNFLDMVRAEEQDELSPIIDEFVVEYLGPFYADERNEYSSSENPLILTAMDPHWFMESLLYRDGWDNTKKLRTMFREGDFDADSELSVLKEFVEDIRNIENVDPEDHVDLPKNVSESIGLKKIALFCEHATTQPDGKARLDNSSIPIARYILGMSLIYISETTHNPELGDYRDAVIWSQAIYSDCDILWTETQWKYEHPIIKQVLDRLDRKPLKIVHRFDEFQTLFD